MLWGLAKATIVILAATAIDEYVYDGQYADAAMSMLRDMRHWFR
jgi:hypothetical protein